MIRNADFSHVTTWVFDLDHTLYPPAARLFDQIERRMTDYVMDRLNLPRAEANRLRQDYWDRFGTTLAGLMRCHEMEPGPYLTYVHDIDFSSLLPDPGLALAIASLPGRRIIHTNATRDYAQKVLRARQLEGLFDAIYGVEETAFHPKPDAAAFQAVARMDGFAPQSAAMFEDDPRNLMQPHLMGMQTVLVGPSIGPVPHIGHQTQDLATFLRALAV